MSALFGHQHVIAIASDSDAVGAAFHVDGNIQRAPIGVARAIAKLASGPVHLSEDERIAVACAEIPFATDSAGKSYATVPIEIASWYGLPSAVAPPAAAQQTIFRRPQR